MWIFTSRTVLHAASHGHISVRRQRALMYDGWSLLEMGALGEAKSAHARLTNQRGRYAPRSPSKAVSPQDCM